MALKTASGGLKRGYFHIGRANIPYLFGKCKYGLI
jgi:hypothetical protein